MEQFDPNDVNSPRSISFLFHVSMWWRIFYGSLRLLLGLALLKLIGSSFTDILTSLMTHEITEDPHDAIFQLLYTFFENHSFTVTYFVAGYLLFWGFIDIFLSIQLLRHRYWAFPAGIILIALFVCYSVFRFTHTHSLALAGVVLIDTGILYLIYREYRLLFPRKSLTA